jgi:alpha-methylacyl-CoA racemase
MPVPTGRYNEVRRLEVDMSGPLDGVRVVEIAGVGPAPFAAMLLADMGAEVIRVDRVAATEQSPGMDDPRFRIPERSRSSVAVDLKSPEGAEIVLRLAGTADAVIEGFRPGVAERLGVGPDECRARNPRLVYGRMTGWGQRGPLSDRAGHDINFISVAGALHTVGLAGQPPVPPVNLVGEGGGGMLLAFGIVCALLEARQSGTGQVVDAGIVDGAAVLLSSVLGMRAAGTWNTERGTNTLDSGSPFYGTYRCADGEYVAVGAAERYFFDRLLDTLGVADDPRAAGDRLDRRRWDAMKECIAEAFAARSRAEWMAVFDDVDACVTPVLSLDEVAGHPHNRARGTFLDIEGVVHPAAAPRFSRTRPAAPRPPGAPGRDSADVLRAAGYSHQQITGFVERHVVAFPDRTAASVIDRTGGRTPC